MVWRVTCTNTNRKQVNVNMSRPGLKLFLRGDVINMSNFKREADSYTVNNRTLGLELFRRRKAVLDDGCCPELVKGARFDGVLEVPFIEKPSKIVIPKEIIPFSCRNRVGLNYKEAAIGFYEKDINFAEVLVSPEGFVDDFARFSAIISPDCSLYRDATLSAQITNVYRNRAIGSFYQRQGLYVIPQVRWGSEETYTKKVLPEKVAFLGIEKYSIVAIGTYGCIRHKDDKYHFEAGLESMLCSLEPVVVLVYGAMPNDVFGSYLRYTKFVQYDNWTKRMHGGNN